MYSSKRTPGRVVCVFRCGPPVGRPVFGSHVSNWLGPPDMNTRMTCFP